MERVSTKQFFTDEGAKQSGKSMVEKQLSSSDKDELELKIDNTYVEVAGHGNFHTSLGTWLVSGNKLTIISNAEKKAKMNGRIYTFSIIGNTMIKTMLNKEPFNTIIYKQEITSIKM